jgi:hypothetical protein
MRSLISPVQLSTTDQVAGTIFYKQLFSFGTWANPMWWWDGEATMELTVDLATKMVQNFNNNVLGSPVPVPLNHTDDVEANTGTVIKLEVGADGLYGYLDIKRPNVVDDINNGLIYDVSIGFDWDYVSQKDSQHYGPTLFHVALVNTPYINNMSGFSEAELSKRNHEYAQPLSVAGKPSVIMMSIDKVEELKRMKFAKITNEKSYPVEVTYTDADGKEVKATIEAGAELEVPTEASEAVTKQITDSVEPEVEETDEERETREKKEADDKAAADQATADKEAADKKAADEAAANESAEEKLAKANAKIAELEAEKTYDQLLAKGKIVPAQRELFFSFAKLGSVKLSTDVKGMKLAKGQSASILTMLSAMLEAGATKVKFGEQGKDGQGEGKAVELTTEQEEKVVRMGFSLDTFKKHLAKGTISLEDLEEN